ncbi:MAG: glycerate kinase [Clostridiaceae bacterium]
MKKFVLAPDSFKGSLSANEICEIWSGAIQAHLPEAEIVRFPVADGGEGLVDAFLRVCGGERFTATVQNPLGEPVQAAYGILPNGSAVIEMASAAGLPMIAERKSPLIASTYGVGQLLLHAEARGVRQVILGLGGSATNDCGVGMAGALGYEFYDAAGDKVEPLANNMQKIVRILPPARKPALSVIAACDVDNPLYGPNGATYTYGAQKGATPEMQAELDAGLINMARVIERDLGVRVAEVPGAGAAGGLGAGVLAFLGGRLVPGIELLLDEAGFDEMLEGADLVFTGEGRIDWQSARGKVPVGVSRRAKKRGIPCVALCGSIGQGAEAVYDEGITAIFTSVNRAATFEEIKQTAGEDMRLLIDATIRLLLAK